MLLLILRDKNVVFLQNFFRLLPIVTALLPRGIKGSSQNLLFHVLRSLTGFYETTSEQELAGRYLLYSASSETSQNLNNRTSLCMSAEEECMRSIGMQPGNYSHIRQPSSDFCCEAYNFPIAIPHLNCFDGISVGPEDGCTHFG